jgi:serine/threonine-protein kinase
LVEVPGYQLERQLGQGGMSEVWAATDMAQQRTVALKVLLPEARANAEIVARFRREAELLRRIDSAHVPRLYEFREDGLILVEEFIEGELLTHVLEQKRFSVEEAIALGTGLARALVELHRGGIVHRDLKPGNVILHPEGRAVLIDLGVSRLTSHDDALTEITSVERAVGTIAYMAPEQFLAARRVTEAVDLYALGAILFRAVAGHHVFGDLSSLDVARTKLIDDARPLDTRREDPVARGFVRLVARLLRRDPELRHQRAGEVLGDLLLLGQGVVPGLESPTAPSIPIDVVFEDERRWPGATPTLALIAGICVGVFVARQWKAPVAHAEVPACAVCPTAPIAPEMCVAPEPPRPALHTRPVRAARRHKTPLNDQEAPSLISRP